MAATAESLRSIVADERWDDLGHLVDEEFFALALTLPQEIGETLRAAPDTWLRDNPRYLMAREIASRSDMGAGILGEEASRRFDDWVAASEKPAARDVLGVQQGRLRFLLAAGRFSDASAKADESLATIENAEDSSGFLDVIPSTLIRIGIAKLLNADPRAAVACFAESSRWASIGGRHPARRHAENYVALTLAILGQYTQAQEHLQQLDDERAELGTLGRSYEAAGILARGLIAVGTLDQQTVTASIADANDEIRTGELWWAASHIRARAALYWGDRAAAITELEDSLLQRRGLAGPTSFAGLVVRSDLATLYQAVGNLPASRHVLSPEHADPNNVFLLAPRTRLDLLLGHPDDALARLREAEAIMARHDRTSVTLLTIKAASETLLGNVRGAADALNLAADAVRRTGAVRMVAEAPIEIRDELATLVSVSPEILPEVFPDALPTNQLTARERDLIRALEHHASIRELAEVLHISPNTAKSHLHSIYRKLGVRSRLDVLRLAGVR